MIRNQRVDLDGVEIFYRESGDKGNPSLLLLHGFPSSSVMFKNLMLALADRFHCIAPDYPGYGFSSFPDPNDFEYSFGNIASTIDKFTDAIGLDSFAIYLHDYGAPIGLRLCVESPQKIAGIIVQNGNAYEEGMGPSWDETKDYWESPTEEKKRKIYSFLTAEGTKQQYVVGVPEHLLQNLSPELWVLDWHFLSRPGNIEMQIALNMDYRNNVKMFPAFQAFFREHRPPALVMWGKHDIYFDVKEAHCYRRDLPNADIHILDGAHMALETNFTEIAELISEFLTRSQAQPDKS